MKHQLPPPLTLDDNGKVTNFAEITRFAYINDTTYRRTDSVSDLLKESYVARLERLVAVQIIERAEMRKQLVETMAAQQVMLTLTPEQAALIPDITVTTSQDAPDDAPANEWGNLIAIGLISLSFLPVVAGVAHHNSGAILLGVLLILAGAGYLLRKKGGVA